MLLSDGMWSRSGRAARTYVLSFVGNDVVRSILPRRRNG